MLSLDHDGIALCGKRKRGKSTLCRALYANEKRVVLYDAKGALKEPREIPCGYVPPDLIRNSKGILRCYVPRRNEPSQEMEWSAYLAIMAGKCVWVCDEFSDALEGGQAGESVKWVIRMGRERDIRFIASFQRPAEVPRMVTAQASDIYYFQTNERNDLQYIAASVSKEASLIVRGLKVGQSLRVKDGEPKSIVETDDPNKPSERPLKQSDLEVTDETDETSETDESM